MPKTGGNDGDLSHREKGEEEDQDDSKCESEEEDDDEFNVIAEITKIVTPNPDPPVEGEAIEQNNKQKGEEIPEAVSLVITMTNVVGFGARLSKDTMKDCYVASSKEIKDFAKSSIAARSETNAASSILVARLDAFERFEKNKKSYSIFSCVVLAKVYFQQTCLKIINSKAFEGICLFVIVANSLMLVFQDPNADESTQNAFLVQMDSVFTILYSIEMGLKIFGLGFLFNDGAYLRDLWNVLDFCVVISAYVSIIGNASSDSTSATDSSSATTTTTTTTTTTSSSSSSGGSSSSLKSLRVLRVLRPLRTISSVQSLKVLILAFFGSLPLLLDTFTVMILVFFVFAIAGLQLFSGLLRQRCFEESTGILAAGDAICGKVQCEIGYICGKMMDNPNLGNSNFDNIMYSLLQVFVVTTMEGWTEIMGFVRDAFTDIAALYFILIVFIGAFFVMNIMLAVIKAKFTEVHEEQKQLAMNKKLTKATPHQMQYNLLMKNDEFRLNFISNRMRIEALKDKAPRSPRKKKTVPPDSEKKPERRRSSDLFKALQENFAGAAAANSTDQTNDYINNKRPQRKSRIEVIGEVLGDSSSSSSSSSSMSLSSCSSSSSREANRQKHRPAYKGRKSKHIEIEMQNNSELKQSLKTDSSNNRKKNSLTHRIRGVALADPVSSSRTTSVSKSFAIQQTASNKQPKVVFAGALLLRKKQQQLSLNDENANDFGRVQTTPAAASAVVAPTSTVNGNRYLQQQFQFEDHVHHSETDNFQDEFDMHNQNHQLNLNIRDFMNKSPMKNKKSSSKHIIFSKAAAIEESSTGQMRDSLEIHPLPIVVASKLIDPSKKRLRVTSMAKMLEEDSPHRIPLREVGSSSEFSEQTTTHFAGGFTAAATTDVGAASNTGYQQHPNNLLHHQIYQHAKNIQPDDIEEKGDGLLLHERDHIGGNNRSHRGSAIERSNSSESSMNLEGDNGNNPNAAALRQAALLRKDSIQNASKLLAIIKKTEKQLNKFVEDDDDKLEQQMQDENDREEEEQQHEEQKLDEKQQDLFDKLLVATKKKEVKLAIDFAMQPVASSMKDVMQKTEIARKLQIIQDAELAMKMKRYTVIHNKKSERKALASAPLTTLPLTLKNINAMNSKSTKGKDKKPSASSVISSGSNKLGNGTLVDYIGGVGGGGTGGIGSMMISNRSTSKVHQVAATAAAAAGQASGVLANVNGGALSQLNTSTLIAQNNGSIPIMQSRSSPRWVLNNKLVTETKHVYDFFSHLDAVKKIKAISCHSRDLSVVEGLSSSIQRKLLIVESIREEQKKKRMEMLSQIHVAQNEELKNIKGSAMKSKHRNSIRSQKQFAWFAASPILGNSGFGGITGIGTGGSSSRNLPQLSIDEVRKVIFEPDEDAPNVLQDMNEEQFDKIYEGMMKSEFQKGSIQANIWTLDQVIPKYPVSRQNLIVNALNTQDKVLWMPGIPGLWTMFSKKVEGFVSDSAFEKLIMLTVVMNTTLLAFDGMFTDETTMNVMETMNSVFTYVFIVEMGLKLIAYGIRGYVSDTMNIFDGIIVLFSLVELIVSTGGSKAFAAFKSVRIFRTFRVLRVTKLLRSLSFMKIIIGVVSRSMSSFLNVALLLFLFIFIYSLLGWQIFSGNLAVPAADLGVRSDFETFSHSFITVFQILTMENWQQVLYVTLSSSVNKFVTLLYLVSWIFIGNLSLLNLFLAILLDGFTNEDAQSDAKEVEHELNKIENDDFSDTLSVTTTKLFANDTTSIGNLSAGGNTTKRDEKKQDKEIRRILAQQNQQSSAGGGGGGGDNFVSEAELEDIEQKLDDDDAIKEEIKREAAFRALPCEKSIFLFSKKNIIRKIAFRIYKLHQFDAIILTLIVVSSLKLAFDTYLTGIPDDEMTVVVSDYMDIFFNSVFAIESVIKIISLGFILQKESYLRDSWNRIDFIIVVTSLLDMFVAGVDLPALKILRMLRTLRPLRFVSHNVNIKIVVIALFQSMGAIFNVLIVLFLVYLMFAILGMSFLANKMGRCQIDNYHGISRSDCALMNAEWTNSNTNFDNVGTSLITLYVMGTLEGWPDMMYTAVDGVGDGEAPVKNANLIMSLFFVAFILVGSFFFLNLFIGAICFNFDQAHKNEKSSMYSFLTEEQRNWIEMQKMILRAKPDFSRFYVPTSKYRLKVFNAISSKGFEIGIMVCIILNILTMAMSYEGMSDSLTNNLETANYVFTGVFMSECILSIFALGWKGYWIVAWNKFDFVVVVTSAVDIIMTFLLSGQSSSFLRIGPQLIRIIRVMRVSRLLKLSKNLEGLQKILDTMVLSFPSMMNIGALTLLVIYIYSVLACYLFGSVTVGKGISDTANFATFHNSIITLFRSATGEDWFVIMYDVSKTTECIEGQTCGSIFAIPFFLSFILIGRFVMLNLFILVILNDFEEYHLRTDSPVEKFQTNLESFMSIWSKYTQESRGLKIKDNKIVVFFQELLPPLGFKGSSKDKQKIASELFKLNIPNIDDYIYFNDLLFAAMKRVYGEKMAQHTSKELAKYIVQQEKITKKQLGQINAKELTNLGSEYKALKAADFSKLMRQTNPVVQGIFVRMTYMAWRRYTGLVNDQKLHDNDTAARERVVVLTEYEDTDSSEEEEENQEEDQQENAIDNPEKSMTSKSSRNSHNNHHHKRDNNNSQKRNIIRQRTRFVGGQSSNPQDDDEDDEDNYNEEGDNDNENENDDNQRDSNSESNSSSSNSSNDNSSNNNKNKNCIQKKEMNGGDKRKSGESNQKYQNRENQDNYIIRIENFNEDKHNNNNNNNRREDGEDKIMNFNNGYFRDSQVFGFNNNNSQSFLPVSNGDSTILFVPQNREAEQNFLIGNSFLKPDSSGYPLRSAKHANNIAVSLEDLNETSLIRD